MAAIGAPVATTPAAVADRLVKVFGDGANRVEALRGVSLELPVGRFTAVMGPSGSGKSTLMHCLAGLDSVDGGTVTIGGQDVSAMSDHQRTLLRRDHVGFIFQAFNLLPSLTALENITLPLTLAGRRPDPAWLQRLLDITGLADRLRHTPSELSGGQQQRVAVARALAPAPAIVFADEPTGALDTRSGEVVLSQYVEQAYARELLADGSGAVGYLLKDRVMDVEDFVGSVRRVVDGGTVLDPEVVAKLVTTREADDGVRRLSTREREVLGLMAQGRSNAAIAAALVVTEKAVGKHIGNIFTKLDLYEEPDANRRVLAVLRYLQEG